MTALMWAARKDAQAGVLKELIIAGADLNIQTKEVYVYWPGAVIIILTMIFLC